MFCTDPERAEMIRSLRVHGKGQDKYDNIRIGLNSRLDTLQAAILLEKLAVFADEIEARNRIAVHYSTNLRDLVTVPLASNDVVSTWAQYTIVLSDNTDRAALQSELKSKGVPTVVYYPRPLHSQSAFAGSLTDPEGTPVSDRLAGRVLSLPMHPDLSEHDQDRVIDALHSALT